MSTLFFYVFVLLFTLAEFSFNRAANQLIKRSIRRCFSEGSGPTKYPLLPTLPKSDMERFNILTHDKEFLLNAPIPSNLLIDPDFFEDAVQRGERSVCYRLLKNGQRVRILNSNGNNLLVKIIEKGMTDLIGILLNDKKTRDEASRALNVVDASTGKTPMKLLIEYRAPKYSCFK